MAKWLSPISVFYWMDAKVRLVDVRVKLTIILMLYNTDMEKISHIKETQSTDRLLHDRALGESPARRPEFKPMVQNEHYDSTTETATEKRAVREYLNSFDESLLKEIFSDYIRKSGNEQLSMNWIPFIDVQLLYTPNNKNATGSYSTDNTIQLDCERLSTDRLATLWCIIHEECHAVSQLAPTFLFAEESEIAQKDSQSVLKTGVMTSTLDLNTWEKIKLHELINEGITELITERIFQQYTSQTGQVAGMVNAPLSETGGGLSTLEHYGRHRGFRSESYARAWLNVAIYVGIISAITGVPTDTVDKSIIRTYFRNGEIVPSCDTDAVKIFEDIHPELPEALLDILNNTRSLQRTPDPYYEYQEVNLSALHKLKLPNFIKYKIQIAIQDAVIEWGRIEKNLERTLLLQRFGKI